LLSGPGPFEQVTSVSMPKAAVDKNYSAVAREYKIGMSGQSPVMKSVSETLLE
jgi:hypothetical protein